MHGPGDHCGIVEIRIEVIRELKRPSAAGEMGTSHAPVARFIEQLLGLQPIERAHRCGARGLVTGFLHGEGGERGIPNRRDAGLAISAGGTHHQKLLYGAFCRDAPRIIRRITQDHHGFQGIDHRRENGAEAVLAIEASDKPTLGAPCRELAHGLGDQGVDHAADVVEQQECLRQHPGTFEVMPLLLGGRREQLADAEVARILGLGLQRAENE